MKSTLCCPNGTVGITVNGRNYCFAATRSFRPEGRILHDFSEYGFKFFNVFPSGIMTALGNRTIPYSQFGPVWVGDHTYNWDNLRSQCNEFFPNLGPDTYVSAAVHLDPPPWFVESHPGMVDHWDQMIQNIGCTQWKEAARDYMFALIDKLDEWYPERIYAIFLMSGGTTEWYSYHADEVLEKPTELQQQAFASYMGDPDARIPSVEVIHHAEDGVLRHPVIDKPAIDYWKFTNDAVIDTILYFAREAKEHTNRNRLVGLFNAHSFGMQLDWAVRSSYNGLNRLLESPDIDMIFAPASYITRKLESTSGIRVPVDSIRQHGKLFVHEIDSSTHLLKNKKNDAGAVSHAKGRDEAFSCSEDSKMYIRRETGIILAHMEGYWWFDMFSGYYDDPELMNELSRIHDLQELLFEKEVRSVAQAAEFIDAQSNYLLKTNSYYPMVEHQTEALNRTGAPWDQRLTEDLNHPDFDGSSYRLMIFPALFAPESAIRERIRMLREKGVSMLFMHAPGYITGDRFSVSAMEELTGIRFTRLELEDNTIDCEGPLSGISYDLFSRSVNGDVWPGKLGPREGKMLSPVFSAENLDVVLGRFRSNGLPALGYKVRENGGIDFYSACAPLPAEVLREIYRIAGVFIYTSAAEPVYTNSAFECAYSYTGGVRTLYRPAPCKLTDYFTGETFETGPEGTEVCFKPHETKMLLVTPE